MSKTLHLSLPFTATADRHSRHLLHPFIFQDKFQNLKTFWALASKELLAPREKAIDDLMRRIREENAGR